MHEVFMTMMWVLIAMNVIILGFFLRDFIVFRLRYRKISESNKKTLFKKTDEDIINQTKNSYVFVSTEALHVFFSTDQNKEQLSNGLIVSVKIYGKKYQVFEWLGKTNPSCYDPNLWNVMSIEVIHDNLLF